MRTWSWIRSIVLVTCLASCARVEPPLPGADTLLLVTMEGLAAPQTGSGGDPRAHTPHLDRLARRGRQAVEARTPSPVARISLASILTGIPPTEHGLVHEEFALGDVPTIARSLRDHGHRTAAFTETPLANASHGLERGLDRHDTHLDGAASLARALESWLSEKSKSPAFAWIHIGESARTREADQGLGEILRVAEERIPLVVVTSPDADLVPFVVAGPGVARGGLRLGRTSVGDAARLLTASVTDVDAWEQALADPPADRIVAVRGHALPAQVVSRLHEAREHDRAGRPDDARRAYDEALRGEPRLVSARMRAADLARRSGDLAAAARHAEELLERVPEHRGARIVLARVLARRDARRASTILEPLVLASPHDPDALIAAAEVALARGEPAVARQHYDRALASGADAPEALLDIGRGLSRLGLHREAIKTVLRALDRGDRPPLARYTLAYVLERGERFQESVHEYRQLIRDHPDYLPPYRNLGALMARDGELEQAIRLWEEALSRHPGDAGLRANIDAAREALGSVTLGG
jgi:tetratricopeptide (TPR) repeat protein